MSTLVQYRGRGRINLKRSWMINLDMVLKFRVRDYKDDKKKRKFELEFLCERSTVIETWEFKTKRDVNRCYRWLRLYFVNNHNRKGR